MKNLYLLASDKPSRLRYNLSNQLVLIKDTYRVNYDNEVTQHIYIISDEEIKEGDYCIIIDSISVLYGQFEKHRGTHQRNDQWKKIILTTDADLISDGVQEIDDEFLEWFIKNPSCESVEIERNFADEGVKGITHYGKYFLIIPKEEPKQETQGYICPQTKLQCDDECCVSAENCHIESSKVDLDDYAKGLDYAAKWHKYNFIEGDKQETLEEADENKKNLYYYKQVMNPYPVEEYSHTAYEKGFIEGYQESTKWQQQRMYSEVEVKHIVSEALESALVTVDLEQWFKQFKKK